MGFFAGPLRRGGEVQLSYLDSRDRSEPGVSYSTFQQRYALGLSTYLLDPRLLAYSLGVSFQDANVDFRGSDGGLNDYEHSDIGYNVSGTFLPYGTLPVTLYANRQTSDMGSTTFSNLPFRVTSSAVGARASVRRSAWPNINMFAEKATLVSDQAEDKRDEDRRTAGIDFKYKLGGWDTAGDYRYEDVESNLAGASENKIHTANLNAEKAFSEATRVQFLSHFREDNFLSLLTATGGLFLKPSPRQDAQATYGFSQLDYGTTTVRNHNLAAGTTYRVRPWWAVLSGITATWIDSPEASSDTETLRLGTTLSVPTGALDLTGGVFSVVRFAARPAGRRGRLEPRTQPRGGDARLVAPSAWGGIQRESRRVLHRGRVQAVGSDGARHGRRDAHGVSLHPRGGGRVIGLSGVSDRAPGVHPAGRLVRR